MADAPLLAVEAELLLQIAPALLTTPHVRTWENPSPDQCCAVRVLAALGTKPLTASHMDRFPALEHIACFAVGIDGVDLAAAAERGIGVTNGQGANAPDVAEVAVALLLALTCRLNEGQAHIATDAWRQTGLMPFRRALRSMKVGIVGMGAIGQAIAERVAAFGPDIAWWGPRPTDSRHPRAESLLALARDCDVLMVAARADESNRKLIDADVIAALGPEGYLVNVARGSLVDEDALISALREGRLAGAGLDVFATEPAGPEWSSVPRLVAMPHVGGATFESLAALAAQMIASIETALAKVA